MNPLVYVIILIYNGKKWIDNCLNSVFKTNYPNYKVLAVDNASKDGSADYIKEKFPQVELVRNDRNYGFAKGNNIGIKYALKQGADYVVLLNQDTRVDSNWILELVKTAEDDKQIGILSPMQYDYEGKEIDRNFLNNVLLNIKDYKVDRAQDKIKRTYITNRIIGAAMLISKEVIDKIGFFDPLYFLYAEEEDYCRRAIFHGFKIAIITSSKIYHWHTLLFFDKLSKKSRISFKKSTFVFFLKNPNKNFLRNLYDYIKWGAFGIIGGKDKLKNPIILRNFIFYNLWILLKLPQIAWHQYKDRNLLSQK